MDVSNWDDLLEDNGFEEASGSWALQCLLYSGVSRLVGLHRMLWGPFFEQHPGGGGSRMLN